MNQVFLDRAKQYFEKEADSFVNLLSQEATHGFFINSLKAKKDEIFDLIDFNYFKSDINPNAFYHKEKSISKTKAYELGLIYPQDIESSLFISLIDLDSINLVVDLCAAPGGKTINVLNKFKNAFCIANDVNSKRASELSKNLERLGLSNTIITSKPCKDLSKILKGNADLVILDAPCSGEGMIRKYPEILENYSVSNINSLALIQSELLEDAYNLIDKDGYIVYSTCTYAFEEDEKQIESFLQKHEDMHIVHLNFEKNYSKLDGTVKVCQLNNCEGQFICLLKRDSLNDKRSLKYLKSVKNHLVDKFIKDNLDIDEYCLYQNNNNFYMSFKPLIDLDSNVIRNGIYMGEIIKDRFEPSHNMYRSNELINKFKNSIELSDDDYENYIKGLELKKNINNGYFLLTYKGFSLGFGKVSNGIVKNKYPKGLRRL